MIKALIFDFDGVLVESNEIKNIAFEILFAEYRPNKVRQIVDYHIKNGGVSRRVKFRHIYNEILNLKLSQATEDILEKRFSDLVFDKVVKTPFVSGAREFISSKGSFYKFFIASGTPEKELISIVKTRGIDNYFLGIYGAPLNKEEIVKKIFSRYSFKACEVVFIGDAKSDMVAAEKSGVEFIARISAENNKYLKDCKYKIKDLTLLNDILISIANNA